MDSRYLKLPYYLLMKPLKLGNGPLHLQVEPTDACNQKCVMCYRDRLIDKPARMSLDQFKKVIDDVKPSKVNISGLGEPMLNKDIFPMVRYAKSKKIGVTFPTNLTLASRHVEEIVDSGIDVIKASLDAADAETYKKVRGTDHFDKVMDAIRGINELKAKRGLSKPHIRINYALQKSNLDELIDMTRMAVDLEAEAMYIQYLDYVEVGDLKDELIGDMDFKHLREVLEKVQKMADASKIETNISIWLRDLELYKSKMLSMGSEMSLTRKCLFPWLSTFIEANGDVKACPIFTRKRHEGKMGNIFEKPFMDIWNGEAYQDIRRKLRAGDRPYTPCRQCVPQTLSNIFVIFKKMMPGW